MKAGGDASIHYKVPKGKIVNAMLPVFNEYFSPIFAEVGAILASVVRPGIVVGVGYNATNPPITGSEIDYVAHFQDKK